MAGGAGSIASSSLSKKPKVKHSLNDAVKARGALGAFGAAATRPTSSPECQAWFDRGCMWTFNLHREEAVACFQKAVELDPACAMAHWGVALANGPEYNWNESGGFYAVAAQPEGFPSFKVTESARALAVTTQVSRHRKHAN